ncbi:hypothetical protein MNEG_10375 [Monoraphidium neglectum]|uniref:Ubiquinol oxidase n=1 Tax=Monoraphidium neglectum TaxID=145388 RepID=A0A0D2JDD1_9CHLO|nr:hypothetical protein MNEG_10375 [Monoraphidium neglectum]KIY97587.1 hypothetical protein MNEG_10375 [Monoraphidium neglectum]|eukprot:XP_013896607.1 hypothetical protein MNEG_10375 [Monoraphidium neglectum]
MLPAIAAMRFVPSVALGGLAYTAQQHLARAALPHAWQEQLQAKRFYVAPQPAEEAKPNGAAAAAAQVAASGPAPRHPSVSPPMPTGYLGFAANGRLPGAIDFHTVPSDVAAAMGTPAYDSDYLASVQPKHLRPERGYQKVGFKAVSLVRAVFDRMTGYSKDNMTEALWLRRMIFLETVAGVPGMVAGMLRHLKSLRRMERDNGWINTLLQEAENERMHLLTFLTLRDPGIAFRTMVILAQGVFFNAYFLAYLVSPRACHAAVGYLEEEAVKTYTHALKDIDEGKLWKDTPAPAIAVNYWRLPKDATMRDLILAIRADEASHSHVNHTFSVIRQDAPNPFHQGSNHIA